MTKSPRRRTNALLDEMRHTPHLCFAETVRSANRVVTRRYARHLDGLDINASQASLLMRLYYLEETTMAALAEQMETDRTTMVRNVAALERSGHVATIVPDHGRAHRLRLTDRGMDALVAALPHWQAAQNDLRQILGEEAWVAMMGGMRRLVELDGAACTRTARPD